MINPIKIVLVDDDEMTMELIQDYFLMFRSLSLTGYYDNIQDFRNEIIAKNPDICMIDLDIHRKNDGLELIQWTREALPHSKIIACSHDSDRILKAYVNGATGYLLKGSLDDLDHTVRAVFDGELVIPPGLSRQIILQVINVERTHELRHEFICLTEQQRRILQTYVRERDDGRVSLLLNISRNTLRRHKQLLAKNTGKDFISSVEYFRPVLDAVNYPREYSKIKGLF